jgi:predicted nucleic acid-binding protein
MNVTAFVDTNILLYSINVLPADAAKATVAIKLLGRPDLAISVQVLCEFYVQATHPRSPQRLAPQAAKQYLATLRRYTVQEMTLTVFERALALADRYVISLWDALILSAAAELGCTTLYSEDLNDGQDYAGVRVCNPFVTKIV